MPNIWLQRKKFPDGMTVKVVQQGPLFNQTGCVVGHKFEKSLLWIEVIFGVRKRFYVLSSVIVEVLPI